MSQTKKMLHLRICARSKEIVILMYFVHMKAVHIGEKCDLCHARFTQQELMKMDK